MGVQKVLAMLKGGHKQFWGSFYAVARSFSHIEGGSFYAVARSFSHIEGGGAQKVSTL